MKPRKALNTVLTLLAVSSLAVVAFPSLPAAASSHREAPMISQDPTADSTDAYVFRSPDDPSMVTMIANYIPLEQPQGGPNFYRFDDSVLYQINVDNVGDGHAHIAYQFRFKTEIQNKDTFLYNTGPITSLEDPDYNIRQYYDVVRVDNMGDEPDASGNHYTPLARHVPVPPVNIGPRSMPGNYEDLATAAITNLNGGGKVFAGQRDDPFFVDLGSVFDVLGLRPLNPFHVLPPHDAAPGVDGVSGYNVHTIAIQVPISSLHATNSTIGMWTSAYRSMNRILRSDGTAKNSGRWIQVSRLGMPLTNEVLIALEDKDRWNAEQPWQDSRNDEYILNPAPAPLMNALYPVLTDTQTTNRQDLLAVFHTGVPGLNTLPQTTHADELRVNLSIPVTASPNRMGVIAGDLQGFPNGRRLSDDVTDIELRALACSYGAVGGLVYQLTGNCDPEIYGGNGANSLVTDGVDANDKPFMSAFPYEATPWQGYEAMPPTGMDPAKAVLGGVAGAGTLGGLLFVYRRRRTFRKGASAAADDTSSDEALI